MENSNLKSLSYPESTRGGLLPTPNDALCSREAIMQGDHARRSCEAIMRGDHARRSCKAIMQGDHARRSCKAIMQGDHARRSCEAIISSGGTRDANATANDAAKKILPRRRTQTRRLALLREGVCNLYEQSGTQKLIQNRPQQTAAARGRLAIQARTARTTSPCTSVRRK
jgi:hypothetical protein